ncbi:MAG: epoxyqueuosine reductase QueH [Ruminococcaceae bacterium]|nr:epoxyqueuosine reductase QueH [Oscillospiraceae bacterium]
MQRNYQKELDRIIKENSKAGKVPTLLLHACCAPCSSYCLEYLAEYFSITVFFYNPNLYPADEYDKRADEVRRLISLLQVKNPVKLIVADFDDKEFYAKVRGMEKLPEGGERCRKCFELRLEKTAEIAKENSFDFFTTTLTISPLKNAQVINEVGEEMAEKYGVAHLPSDFKKKGGYKRSVELSAEFGLYRQNYCGCVYSVR